MRVLVVNTGSSTLKLSVLDDDRTVASTTITDWDEDAGAIKSFAGEIGTIEAVGHRVVHGGTRFTDPVVVDDAVVAQIDELRTLAPLHQQRSLAGIDAARQALPGIPQIACFDTAFHSTIPRAAYTYALPSEWRAGWPLRRFGFHGLSHAYASRRAAELADRPIEELRIVSCHLGAGASLCAIEHGRSIDTTMGFTPLEGLVMATRSGSIDPGLLLWLQTEGGLAVDDVADALEHRSGLFGLSGTADMREVIAARDDGDAKASLAFDVYIHSLRRALGAMVAVMGHVDVFVFTGGVGENEPAVRAACSIPIDDDANARTHADGEITAPDTPVRTFVVTAREDLEIARQARERLAIA